MSSEKTEKKHGKIQWFFFVVLIPLLFAITLSLVILTVAGLNIFDLAKEYGVNVPGVTETTEEENNETSIYDLEATIRDQETTLEQYQADLDKKDETIEGLNEQITQLQEELNQLRNQREERKVKLENLAEMYTSMSTKNAAAILSELENTDAIDIFIHMDTENRAAILEKMETTKAAELTRELKPQEEMANN